ncbi:MAG: hypothetical protein KF894_00770 [Labilithrix sp.]|nr:hypothetical protein [Labilithrix sp.]
MSTTGEAGTGAERCSACGRSTAQVKRLLAGRATSTAELVICDRCIRECESAIADAPTRIPGGGHTCAFCTKTEEQVAVIVGVGAKKICDECVDAYRASLG